MRVLVSICGDESESDRHCKTSKNDRSPEDDAPPGVDGDGVDDEDTDNDDEDTDNDEDDDAGL